MTDPFTALPAPPFQEPVLVFGLAMAVFLIAPLILERFRVPGLIGLIVAGAILGPHGLHLLDRDPTISLLGNVGLMYLMFLAGEEIDFHGFKRHRRSGITFGVLSFAIPQVLGWLAGLAMGFSMPSAVLLGAVLASHTLLAYPLTLRLGLGKQRSVTVAVGGTMIADTAALLVLSVVAAGMRGSLDQAFWIRLIGSLAVLAALLLVGLPRLARWFFRHERAGATATFVFVLAVLYLGAFCARLAGVEPIVGAFLVGLALNRLIPGQSLLANRIHFVGDALFIPFFMLFVGMLIDPRVFVSGGRVWVVIAVLVVVGTAGKWLAAWVSGQVFGFDAPERWTLFGLSAPRASATLAIALVGFEIKLFDNAVQNGVIVLMLVTCFIGPWVVERYGRALALREERRPYEPREAPRRVLVALANPETAPDLVDLALLARESSSPEPLYLLTVVPDAGGRADEQVATAEKLLSENVAYASGAEVSVQPLTRVDENFASGIARGVLETRTTTLVVGWDGHPSRAWVFGGVLDQVIEQVRQSVIVAKLGHPLNTTRRVIVLVPPGTDHLAGFGEAVDTVIGIASRLGATVRGYTVREASDVYAQAFGARGRDVPVAFERVNDWAALVPTLDADVVEEDLIVLFGARRETVAWHPMLERLPARLADLAPHSFLVLHPATQAEPALRLPTEPSFARALARDRVVIDLPGASPERAVKALLRTAYRDDRRRVRALARRLVGGTAGATIEIAPGVVVTHTHLEDVVKPMVFVGVSREGVHFPGVDDPARVIFLVLSPVDQPELHLAVLAGIARSVVSGQRIERIRDATTVDDVMAVVELSGMAGAAG